MSTTKISIMKNIPKVPNGPFESWTTEDQIKARHEGWMFLFKRIVWSGIGKKPRKEVRIKTAAVLRYIHRRAEAGSEFHQRALAVEMQCRLTSTGDIHALTYD